MQAKGSLDGASDGEDSGDVASEEGDSGAPPQLDDEALEACFFRSSTQKRAEWLQAGGADQMGLRVTITGGAWLMKHEGRAYDYFLAKARTQASKDFCKTYCLAESARYAVASYGEDATWAHNMH
jgi:hypothetical protein